MSPWSLAPGAPRPSKSPPRSPSISPPPISGGGAIPPPPPMSPPWASPMPPCWSSMYSAPGSPYILSTVSKIPVFLIICVVFSNSAAMPFSRRISSKFSFMSLSDHFMICLNARVVDITGRPFPGSLTASLTASIFFCVVSISNCSACVEGFFIDNVKLFSSSSNPNKNK